jgi:hypothetical protein
MFNSSKEKKKKKTIEPITLLRLLLEPWGAIAASLQIFFFIISNGLNYLI